MANIPIASKKYGDYIPFYEYSALVNSQIENTTPIASITNLLLFHTIKTNGTLTVNKLYEIVSNSGANFTDVGAPNNNVGTQFHATGTSPTWGSGSLAELNFNGSLISISGTNEIETISSKFLFSGTKIKLVFSDNAILKNNINTSNESCGIKLLSNSDVTAAANDWIELELRNDNYWYQINGIGNFAVGGINENILSENSQIQEEFILTENQQSGYQKTFTLKNNISSYAQLDVMHHGCKLNEAFDNEVTFEVGTNEVIVNFDFPTVAGETVVIRYWTVTKKVIDTTPYTIDNEIATANNTAGTVNVNFDIVSTKADSITYTIDCIKDGIIMKTINSGIVSVIDGTTNQSIDIPLTNGDYTFQINIGTYNVTTNEVTLLKAANIEYSGFVATVNGDKVDCSVTVTNSGSDIGTATVYFQKDSDTKIQCNQLDFELTAGQSKTVNYTYTGLTAGSYDFKAFESNSTTQIETTQTEVIVSAIKVGKIIVSDWAVIRGKVNSPYGLTFFQTKSVNNSYTGNLGNTAYGQEKDQNWLRFDIPAGMDIANIVTAKIRHYFSYPGLTLTPELRKSTYYPAQNSNAYDIFYENNAMYFQTGAVTKTTTYIEFSLDVTKVKAELVAGASYYFQLKDSTSNYLSNIGNVPNLTELYFTY